MSSIFPHRVGWAALSSFVLWLMVQVGTPRDDRANRLLHWGRSFNPMKPEDDATDPPIEPFFRGAQRTGCGPGPEHWSLSRLTHRRLSHPLTIEGVTSSVARHSEGMGSGASLRPRSKVAKED